MNVVFNYDGERRTLKDIKRENRNTCVAAVFLAVYISLMVLGFIEGVGLADGISVVLTVVLTLLLIAFITFVPMIVLYLVKYSINSDEQKRRYVLNQIIGNKYEVGYFNGKLVIKKSYKYYDEERTETMDLEKFVEKVFSKLENREIVNMSNVNDEIKAIFDISFLDDSVTVFVKNKEA